MLDDSYRRVDINGAELAYIEQGTGAPLVCVHGAASDVREGIERAAAGHRWVRVEEVVGPGVP